VCFSVFSLSSRDLRDFTFFGHVRGQGSALASTMANIFRFTCVMQGGRRRQAGRQTGRQADRQPLSKRRKPLDCLSDEFHSYIREREKVKSGTRTLLLCGKSSNVRTASAPAIDQLKQHIHYYLVEPGRNLYYVPALFSAPHMSNFKYNKILFFKCYMLIGSS
jgi:hypothetical protein